MRQADGLREAAAELAELLGECLENGPYTRHEARTATRTVPASVAPARDVARLWEALARRDEAGERYLARRGLLDERGSIGDLVRLATGRTGDRWLDERAAAGFGVAFAARDPEGRVRSLSLRWTREEPPPEAFGKAPSLARCTTRGLAICRPEIRDLASGDSEYAHDELVVLEGGPDTLAAALVYGAAELEGLVPPTWALGAIGVSNVPAVLGAFATVVRGRVVHLALDADPVGKAAIPAAAAAAWVAGAARVTRIRPPRGKDVAAALEEAAAVYRISRARASRCTACVQTSLSGVGIVEGGLA